jgi:hypothetical protein
VGAFISSLIDKFPLLYETEDVERLIVLFVILISFLSPHIGSAQFRTIERWFRQAARHTTLAVLGVGALALVIRAAALPILPVPSPLIHDEYENLLMADTFAHGRVTNPPHPMRAHFETFHVLQEPTYTGIVPPAQAMALAAGEVIGGHPFIGVWLSVGIFCAAVCWMLQGWLPPEWALLGGLLAIFRFDLFSYWANSYWGGAVAATGAALILGAYPRIQRRPRLIDAIVMGIGLAILANSRPYEGFILCLPIAGGILVWLFRARKTNFQAAMLRVALPLSLILIATIGAMGYYNWRVTGHALKSPYEVSLETVNPVPYFPWQALGPVPQWRYRAFRDFYLGWDLPQYEEVRTLSGWFLTTQTKIRRIARFYFGAALGFPILLAILIGGFRAVLLHRLRFLLLCAAAGFGGILLEVQYSTHYAAPLAVIFIAFAVQGTRYLYVCGRRNQSRFLFAARAVPLICLISLTLLEAQRARSFEVISDWPNSWISVLPGNIKRDYVLQQLEKQSGRHLVLVRYTPRHNIHHEWVYNESDIDSSKVVWAHDIDPAQNQELLDYYHDRHVWLLEPDSEDNPTPYPNPVTPVVASAGSQRRPGTN